MQGLYGLFPFTVSDSEVCTFRDLKKSRELVYAEHKTLDGLSRLQYTGRNLDTVSLTILNVENDRLKKRCGCLNHSEF